MLLVLKMNDGEHTANSTIVILALDVTTGLIKDAMELILEIIQVRNFFFVTIVVSVNIQYLVFVVNYSKHLHYDPCPLLGRCGQRTFALFKGKVIKTSCDY